MTERPILFSAPMVRALLDRKKTQTRRVAKLNAAGRVARAGKNWHPDDPEAVLACPFGQPGDRLWVRETHLRSGDDVMYDDHEDYDICKLDVLKLWRTVPSIHMPRWASRIALDVIAVRLERLLDITSSDCIAEGIGLPLGRRLVYGSVTEQWNLRAFAALWDSLNAKRGFGWIADPLIWVIEFRVVQA
jgi:hypothetical protein